MRVVAKSTLIAGLLSLSVACGGGGGPEANRGGTTPASGGGPAANVNFDKNAYPVFPNADSGADPSVPAEQGGKGFTGEGWETNTDFDLIGDSRAVRGGVLRQGMMTDFPGTLRFYGPNGNSEWHHALYSLVYESLLNLHPTTLDYIPGLATHWQISDDR